MKKLIIFGAGKIGRTIIADITKHKLALIKFVYDPFATDEQINGVPVKKTLSEDDFNGVDLIVEAATPEVVKEQAEVVLKYCDMMTFSLTAFANDNFRKKVETLCEECGTSLYMPHGAILGLDGIADGRDAFTEIRIETIKNPKALGRSDKERTVLYEGSTREATKLFPRNVNVHAAVALAGIGFDKTVSKITSDPEVNTNTHIITLKGPGVDFRINVSSFSEGGVSGKYVPLSACGSLERVLKGQGIRFA